MTINYRTLTVCRAELPRPFNDWTKDHIGQGFSWRPGSVCFRTLETDNALIPISVDICETYSTPAAVRIIMVPFEADVGGVELTSPVSDSWILAVPPGLYALHFAIERSQAYNVGIKRDELWLYHLTLVPGAVLPQAAIVRADSELAPPRPLQMVAQPA